MKKHLVVFLLFAYAIMLSLMSPTPAVAAPAAVKRGLITATAVSSNTNVFASNLPHSTQAVSSAFRVTVCLSGGDTVLAVRLDTSTTDYTMNLNGGTALTADCLYTFTFAVDASLGYNFRVGTDCTIAYLLVEEVVNEAL